MRQFNLTQYCFLKKSHQLGVSPYLENGTVATLTQLHVRMEVTCGAPKLIVCEYGGLYIVFLKFCQEGKYQTMA